MALFLVWECELEAPPGAKLGKRFLGPLAKF
jgi:hypothetical protein